MKDLGIVLLSVIVLILVGIIMFNKPKPTIVTKPEYIKGDTVKVMVTKPYYIEKIKEVYKESNKSITDFDTTLISNKDTIELKAKVEIDTMAQWFVELTHKDYHWYKIDTIKVQEIVEKIVTKDIEWYEKPYTNFIAGAIAVILIMIGLQ